MKNQTELAPELNRYSEGNLGSTYATTIFL